jgi:hypothetical protein
MDARSFDEMARSLRNGLSRRGAVMKIMRGVPTALFLGHGAAVRAGCKKVGKKCDKSRDCCDHATCKGGKHSKCKCKGGYTKCGGKCYDLDKDKNHCGGCNADCDNGTPCTDGVCCVPVTTDTRTDSDWQCTSSEACCDGGTCCTLLTPDGEIANCFDLLTLQTFCGTSCETAVNCLNFNPVRQCINGECVEL